jgi:hypothetical protein
MENGTAFFKISPKSAHVVLDSIPLQPHHGYGPPTTDGRPSASGWLNPAPWGWRTQRRKRGSGEVAPVGREYANTAFQPASHRRWHAHRAGGGSGGVWAVATLTATPRFLYGLHHLGCRMPRHRGPTARKNQPTSRHNLQAAIAGRSPLLHGPKQAEPAHWTKTSRRSLRPIGPNKVAWAGQQAAYPLSIYKLALRF